MVARSGKLFIYYVDIWLEDGKKLTARIQAKTTSNALRSAISEYSIPQGLQNVTKMEVKPNPLPGDQYERRKLLKKSTRRSGSFDINISI